MPVGENMECFFWEEKTGKRKQFANPLAEW
jgi:hypothetical protein